MILNKSDVFGFITNDNHILKSGQYLIKLEVVVKSQWISKFFCGLVISLFHFAIMADPVPAASERIIPNQPPVASTSGEILALDVTGSISGTVYETDGLTPIANIFVFAGGDTYGVSACTNAMGQYTLTGLPLDVKFTVQASPPWARENCGQWSDYVQEFWQETRDPNNASLIVLTAQAPDRINIGFTLDRGGVISGMVYESDGTTPIPQIAISIHDEFGDYSQSVCAGADGHYELHGVPFDMPVRVMANSYRDGWCDSGGDYISEYWEESPDTIDATVITLTEHTPTPSSSVDFTLDLAGSISGTVYEADGSTPIPDMLVISYGVDYSNSACTGSDGKYTLHNMPFGLSVYLFVGEGSNWCGGGNSHILEFWPGVLSIDEAVPLTVTAQEPNLYYKDFALDAGTTSNANIVARYMVDIIEAVDWPDGAHLTMQIEDMTTIQSPDYSSEADVAGFVTSFDLNGLYDIKPGMLVIISGSSITRIVRIGSVEITSIDQEADRIYGTTDPNGWMWMFFEPSCCRPVRADSKGNWMIDYSIPGPNGEPVADIGPGSNGWINSPSGDGKTSVDWSIPYPSIDVWHMDERVEALNWPAGTQLTLLIEDPSTITSPDYVTDGVLTVFDLNGQFDIKPGMIVTVSGASITKSMVVFNLNITDVNPTQDKVTGTTDPNNELWMYFNPSCCRVIQADDNGNWAVDFSIPGPKGEPIADIRPGSNGAIHANDGDGDRTSVAWFLPFNSLHAVPSYPEVHGHNWVTGLDVKLIIDDDADSTNGFLYTFSKKPEVDPWCGYPCFDLTGIFQLQTGQYVSLTDGVDTLMVRVSPLAVTNIDFDTDTISGIADPYARVLVDVWTQGGGTRSVFADADGLWLADFSVVGIEDYEQDLVDIQPGDNGRVIQPNPGTFNGTLEYWNLVPYVTSIIRANLNPTATTSINFKVVFSESVTGVTVDDFDLNTTGITGASINNLSGSGSVYTVTVNTGSGNGTIRLDVIDDNSILDAAGASLGGTSLGDGNFTNGEVYDVVKLKPGTPVLLSPSTGNLLDTLQPTLDWKDSSPAPHHYQLQVSKNNTFTDLVVDEADLTTSEFTFTSDLDPGRRYFWRVRSFNILDQTKGWSTTWNFRTPLDAPTLGTPACGASLLTDRPAFDWLDVEGAASYTIQVSPTTSFGTLLLNAAVPASEYAMSKDLPQNKTLYWRVMAQTSVVSSPWSVKCSFTTGNPPTVPLLASPANNALLKDYTPTLKWYKSATPSGTAFERYELQLDDNNDFSSPEIEFSTTDGLLTETSYTPPSDLNPNTRYYWRVRAVNLVGADEHASGWSAGRSFRTIMLPPVLLLPADGSTEVALKPFFDWEEVEGAASYTIQISTSASFSTYLVNTNRMVSNFTPTTNLPKGKTLYWRVRANGPNGPSAWSVFQFTTPP